jgi:hypothetical protein
MSEYFCPNCDSVIDSEKGVTFIPKALPIQKAFSHDFKDIAKCEKCVGNDANYIAVCNWSIENLLCEKFN